LLLLSRAPRRAAPLALPRQLGKVLAECSIMFELAAHPCIVKLLAAFQLQPAGTFALVMELLPGGELYTRVAARGYLPEPEARTILAQILDALRCVLLFSALFACCQHART
jgi:serine/threonine protein kinase